MARKVKNVHLEKQQVKAKKQKRLAIILSAVLVLVLVIEVPKTMKLMSPQAKAPVISSSSAAPAANPQAATTTPLPAAAQAEAPATPAPTAQAIVASVQPQPGAGQLTQFQLFASKDPFDQTVQKTSSATSTAAAKPSSAKTAPSGATKPPKLPPAPPPASAVISVNGELMNVTAGTDFPGAGTAIYAQVGSALFHLVSLTQKTAVVAIAGGSYADGAPTLTLTVGKPVTLQNTADGTRYTLLLEPQGTPMPTSTTAGTSTPPAGVTTTASVVPSSSGG